MRGLLRWWLSARRNANFWDWMQDTYSEEELRRLVTEATDSGLIRPWPLFTAPPSSELQLRKAVRRLMRRYGDEIWMVCLAAGGYDPERGPTGLECVARLNRAFQVYNVRTFEEFLVRNALKFGARQVLRDRLHVSV